MLLVAIVGMCGSGKSEFVSLFASSGFYRVRFGDLTEREVKKRGMEINEPNERIVRESLRKEHGPAVYAILNLPEIENALKEHNVVIDGLYSWSEHLILKKKFPKMKLVAVYASPEIRYKRLASRKIRPLTEEESRKRDYSEIENIEKAGPIAIADYTVTNEGTLKELAQGFNALLGKLGK